MIDIQNHIRNRTLNLFDGKSAAEHDYDPVTALCCHCNAAWEAVTDGWVTKTCPGRALKPKFQHKLDLTRTILVGDWDAR